MMDRFVDLLLTGQFDAAAPLFVEDHVTVDRRRTVSSGTTIGRDAIVRAARTFRDLGFASLDSEPIAVRGERLHLSRFRSRTGGGDELVRLGLTEINGAGLGIYTAWYDEDDLDAAIDELDERYIAGEGAAHADVLRAAKALDRAGRNQDFDAMQALMSPDFVVDDHRPLAFGEGDRDYFMQASRSTTDAGLTPVSDINCIVHVVGRALLVDQKSHRLTEYGTPWEWNGPLVALFDSSYRATRIEYFAEDDFEAALRASTRSAPRARCPRVSTTSPSSRMQPAAPPRTRTRSRVWRRLRSVAIGLHS